MHIFMGILGVGLLFPWNAMLSAEDYFIQLLDAHYSIATWTTFVYQLFNSATSVMSVAYGVGIDPKLRMSVIFAVDIVLFILLSFSSVIYDATASPALLFWYLMVLIGIMGLGTAYRSSAFFDLAGTFPMTAVIAGSVGLGVAGLITFALRMIAKEVFVSEATSNIFYFVVTILVLLLCLACLFLLYRNSFAQTFITIHTRERKIKAQSSKEPLGQLWGRSKRVIAKASRNIFDIYLVYVITLGVLPGLYFKIPPNQDWGKNGTLGVLLIGLFQIFDFVGRSAPLVTPRRKQSDGKVVFWIPAHRLWIFSIARLVFIPFFFLLAYPLNNPFIKSNVWAYIASTLLAFTNGWISSLAMSYIPAAVDPEDQGLAGSLCVAALTLGLFSGSILAIPLSMLLEV